MFNKLAIIAVFWLAARVAYGVDFAGVPADIEPLIGAWRQLVLTYAALGALALPVVSLACRGVGFYTFMYLLDQICFWLSQVLICLISFAAVVFWFEAGVNLWHMLGVVALAPFFVLASAAVSLTLFDFNYPLRETLTAYLGLPLFSLLIIWGSRFLL